jgi:hypothetical protein
MNTSDNQHIPLCTSLNGCVVTFTVGDTDYEATRNSAQDARKLAAALDIGAVQCSDSLGVPRICWACDLSQEPSEEDIECLDLRGLRLWFVRSVENGGSFIVDMEPVPTMELPPGPFRVWRLLAKKSSSIRMALVAGPTADFAAWYANSLPDRDPFLFGTDNSVEITRLAYCGSSPAVLLLESYPLSVDLISPTVANQWQDHTLEAGHLPSF